MTISFTSTHLLEIQRPAPGLESLAAALVALVHAQVAHGFIGNKAVFVRRQERGYGKLVGMPKNTETRRAKYNAARIASARSNAKD